MGGRIMAEENPGQSVKLKATVQVLKGDESGALPVSSHDDWTDQQGIMTNASSLPVQASSSSPRDAGVGDDLPEHVHVLLENAKMRQVVP